MCDENSTITCTAACNNSNRLRLKSSHNWNQTSQVLSSDMDEAEEQPSLEVMARSNVYNAGETKAIFCKGINIEDIDWYNPSGTKIQQRNAKNSSRIYVEKKKQPTGLLVPLIIHAIEVSDSGNWTCIGGELNETINIIVGIKVNFTTQSETLEGDEGRNVRLNCEAKGVPEPVVDWYKEKDKIDDRDRKYSVIKKNHNHILEIKNLSPNDIGEYKCVAIQKLLSYFTEKIIYLNVRHAPVFYDPRTYAITPTSVVEVYALLNKVKNITCSVVANPAPTFKWNKRVRGFDRDITDDSVVISDNRTSILQLSVYNESYLGEYKCTASNSKGDRSIIFDVQLAEAPMPPSFIQYVSSNATSISFNVSCCMEGNATSSHGEVLEVRGYKLQLVPFVEDMFPNWDSAFQFSFDINDEGNYTLITADNLPNTTIFIGRICSTNDAGDSDWVNLPFNPNTTDHGVALFTSLGLLLVTLIAVRLN